MREIIINLVNSQLTFGYIFLAIGLFFLLFPKQVVKINEWAKGKVFTDSKAVKHPRSMGSFLLGVSIFLFVLYVLLK